MSDSVVYVYIKRYVRSIGHLRIFPKHNFGLFRSYRTGILLHVIRLAGPSSILIFVVNTKLSYTFYKVDRSAKVSLTLFF